MILKHRDLELLRFEWTPLGGVHVTSVNEAARQFWPLELKGVANDETLLKWLQHRVVPRGRAHIQDLLIKMGYDPHDLKGIVTMSHALSLNDVYWVVGDASKARWADYNLYTNEFSKAISYMAFAGGGSSIPANWHSSPEFTTNGMLAKCWRRMGNKVVLYKGGTKGAVNAGFEPYSEYYAAQIAEALGLDHVSYGLSRFKDILCSTCPLFTSDKYGFVAAGRVMDSAEALKDERFADIFLFDALIFNTDRHLGNFGYLVDNDTNRIVGAAPIFDNGYGLFSLAVYTPGEKHDEFVDLRRFISRVHPALYVKWLGLPGLLSSARLARLERLRGFRFRPHENYNLPTERLRQIEDFLQKRILQIIQYGEKADELLKIDTQDDNVKGKTEEPREHEAQSARADILLNLDADPFITYDDLAAFVGLSKATVVRYVSQLKKEGRVMRVGSDKTGSWKVVR